MIRLARVSDAGAIAAIYKPIVESTTISFEEHAPGEDTLRVKIADGMVRYPWLVEDVEGAVLGYVYASEHRARAAYRWSVDVSAYVHESARGRGIGSRLYRALFGLLERQRFHRAFAGIALPNEASVALHRAVGFTPVGVYREVGFKLGAWRDVMWMERPLGPSEPPPGDPLALAAVGAETYLASRG